MPKLAFCFTLAFFLFACGNSPTSSNNQDENSPTSSNNQEASRSPIAASFSIQDKFGQESNAFVAGEKIDFVFEIENTSDASFSYQDTSPSLTVKVSKEKEPVWHSEHGFSSIQVIQEFTIPARQNFQATFEWDGTDFEGVHLAPGMYFVDPKVDIPFDSDISNIPERLILELR